MHIFGVVLTGLKRGFETNSGGHVERQWTSSLEVNFAHRFAPNVTNFVWMCCGSMTPGSREGIGVDGRRNPSRKPDGCDEEESGEQANEERSTKGEDGVEILNPSATGLSSGSAPVLPASAPNRTGPGSTQQPQTHAEPGPPGPDQHHFLRSSVRPPSKRIRKDSIGSSINGHGGAKSKGNSKWPAPKRVCTGGISRAKGGGVCCQFLAVPRACSVLICDAVLLPVGHLLGCTLGTFLAAPAHVATPSCAPLLRKRREAGNLDCN